MKDARASSDRGRGLGDELDLPVQDGDTGRLQQAEKGQTSLSENLNDKRRKKTVCSWRKTVPREGFWRLKG